MDPITFLQALCAFGARPVGSPANQAATEFVRQTYAGLGLDAIPQPYPCPYWEPDGKSILRIGGCEQQVTPHLYSPNCQVEARVTACGTLDELRAATVRGQILLLHGQAVAQPTIASYYCYATGPDAVLDLLLEKQPAAILAVQTNPLHTFDFIENWDFPIPSACITPELARDLIRAGGQPAHLTLRGCRTQSSAANVVARLPGAPGKRVVLCAHFDTAFDTPGAIDNASGSAVLYGAALHFAGRRPTGHPALEFVAFNGEDSGGVDFTAYEAQVRDFNQMAAVINIDGVGAWVGSPTITFLGENPAIAALVERAAAEMPGLARIDPWYESDHTMFFFRGVPAIAIGSRGCPPVLHRPADTPDWIDPTRITELVGLVTRLVDEIAAM